MVRLGYLAILIFFSAIVGTGLLFLCAASVSPERMVLAFALLVVGVVGSGWTALSYSRWYRREPSVLAARITDLAAQGDGEVSLAQVMAALDVPAAVAQAAMDHLQQKDQCHLESRANGQVYVFPGLKERRMIRKCVYCGSTFPVREPLQKCPNCGGNLELVKQ